MSWLDQVKFDDQGLIPVIAQDYHTGKILMMAWANREALQQTVEKKQAIYWSRSRQKLWHKGETSGHFQQVHEMRLDCDGDAIVLKVTQVGDIACHTGRQSCFYQLLTHHQGQFNWVITDDVLKDPTTIYQNPSSAVKKPTTQDVLTSLNHVLQQRKNADPDSSYVASLYHKGLNKILEKVGEEATEAIIAAKELQNQQACPSSAEKSKQDLVYEIADVWFHTMVTLAWFDLPVNLVQQELARRFGLSGIEEKANR